MNFENLGLIVNHELLQKTTNTLYQPITTDTLIYAAQVGLVAGIAIAAVGMILGFLKFSALDLTTYMGCILTNQSKGLAPFIAGTLFHFLVSAALGIVYLYVLYSFNIPATIVYGLALGIGHTCLSGSLMVVLDSINPCVTSGTMKRMGFAASAQGQHAMITYCLIHMTFAVIVVMLLVR